MTASYNTIPSTSLLIQWRSSLLKLLTTAMFLVTATSVSAETAKQWSQAEAVLNSLHQSAAEANWNRYFSLYLPDAIFIGTDATEHWTMSEFEGYARPTDGWKYTVQGRTLVPLTTLNGDKVLVFDELLNSASYGLCRGTGTLLLTNSGWKIAQYHLSFPIPNEIAKEITGRIKTAKK
ncbi:hypothetical protein EKG38_13120 [Shewanella canadensis]|uniref:SnoaL-like domain-containing protein n=1 Tax=Shewanella canadensis TaxID=271096 RepID=A0A3S0J5P1_9GAMM|nr:nuclear transport factor 2 family protein [Shewanella canadensis]RTR38451.1 hypothetical protein EKG38_13120 [Shewanella canadensis]